MEKKLDDTYCDMLNQYPDVLTVKEVAEILRINKTTAYEIFKWSIEEQQWPSDNNLSINNLPALEYQFLNVMPTPEELTMISTVYITVNKDFGYRDRIKIEEYIRCKIFEDLLHEFYNAYLYEINKDPGYEKIDYISRIKHMPLYLLTEEPDGIFYYKSFAC